MNCYCCCFVKDVVDVVVATVEIAIGAVVLAKKVVTGGTVVVFK